MSILTNIFHSLLRYFVQNIANAALKMAEQTVPCGKRRTPAEEQPTKCRKIEQIEAVPQFSLSDVNIDCLEKIFLNLDIPDLVAVAQKNNHLKVAAQLAYQKNYKHIVRLYVDDCLNYEYNQLDNEISSSEMGFLMPLIRCFGHFITELGISMSKQKSAKKKLDHILNYTNEHCKGLKKIEIDSAKSNPFKLVSSPFPEVVELVVWIPKLRCKRLNWLFPKLQRLTCSMDDFTHIPYHFPECKWLDVSFGGELIQLLRTTCDHIAKHIRLNPQLQKLSLSFRTLRAPCMDLIRTASERLPALEYLNLRGEAYDSMKNPGAIPIHFKTVNTFIVNWCSAGASLPFTFDRLQSLSIGLEFEDLTFCYRSHHDFVMKHRSISKLSADASFFRKFKNIMQILPLQEVTVLRSSIFSETRIVAFLKKMHTLNQIQFSYANCDRDGSQRCYFYRLFEKQHANEWTVDDLPSQCSLLMQKKIAS